jgi:excisionase family DNA binding protein
VEGGERVRRLLSLAEAAELTGVTRRAIEGRVERGRLPHVKQGSRRYVRLEDLYAAGLLAMDPGPTAAAMLDTIERLATRVGELEAELRQTRGG